MSPSVRRLKLRRPDTCVVCARPLQAGDVAVWDATARNVRCLECESAPTLGEPSLQSVAGASARREYERRRSNREARLRKRFGSLGGVVLAVSGEPQHQRAWARGAEGEMRLASKLECWTADRGVVVLHDRSMPAGRGNIDHLAVGPSGVTVIDAKHYRGRIEVRRRGGLLGPRSEHLFIGRRDQTKLVDGVLAQAAAVRQALAGGPHANVSVRSVLCFVDGDWPMIGRLAVRDVPVMPPRQAAKLCGADGPLDQSTVGRVAATLAAQLPPA